MRHDRHCFGRLEQEDQRLKKHDGRWMDIVRSLQHLFHGMTKNKDIFFTNFLGDFNVRPIQRTDSKRTIERQFQDRKSTRLNSSHPH